MSSASLKTPLGILRLLIVLAILVTIVLVQVLVGSFSIWFITVVLNTTIRLYSNITHYEDECLD